MKDMSAVHDWQKETMGDKFAFIKI